MPLPTLESIGLTKNEAQLYDLLLRLGEVPAAKIVAEAGLKRPTVYKTLYSLEKKGLVIQRDITKKLHFRPESPTQLLALAEQEHEAVDRAREDVRRLIPQLTSSYILAVKKPVVTTFEGVEGLKQIYEDTIREGKEIYAVLQTAEVNPTMYAWLTNIYIKKRRKAGIPAKVIVASGKWSEEYQSKDEQELRETILVPNEQFPFQHEVDIYGNKVAFINYKKGEALVGIVINHPQIAQTMKAWFDLAWIGAKQLPHAFSPTPATRPEN